MYVFIVKTGTLFVKSKSPMVVQCFCKYFKLLFADNENETIEVFGNQRFISAMEQIKQQIARENINFVRFEATDLHGVSRSKTVPVRFFHVITPTHLSIYLSICLSVYLSI